MILSRPLSILLIALMFFCGCSKRENRNVDEIMGVNSQSKRIAHDSASLVAEHNAAVVLPIVNRPHYHTVEIKQMKFHPAELTVSRGDTVVWVNNGITAHDVTAQPEVKWTSSSMPVGTTWKMVVNESSDYYCSIHIVMRGKLVVK